MSSLVLDASASVELLDTSTGRRLQELVPADAQWWVPEHFYAEVAEALRRAELRASVPPARVAEAMTSLQAAPVRRAQVRPLLTEAWGKRSNLTILTPLRRAGRAPRRPARHRRRPARARTRAARAGHRSMSAEVLARGLLAVAPAPYRSSGGGLDGRREAR